MLHQQDGPSHHRDGILHVMSLQAWLMTESDEYRFEFLPGRLTESDEYRFEFLPGRFCWGGGGGGGVKVRDLDLHTLGCLEAIC